MERLWKSPKPPDPYSSLQCMQYSENTIKNECLLDELKKRVCRLREVAARRQSLQISDRSVVQIGFENLTNRPDQVTCVVACRDTSLAESLLSNIEEIADQLIMQCSRMEYGEVDLVRRQVESYALEISTLRSLLLGPVVIVIESCGVVQIGFRNTAIFQEGFTPEKLFSVSERESKDISVMKIMGYIREAIRGEDNTFMEVMNTVDDEIRGNYITVKEIMNNIESEINGKFDVDDSMGCLVKFTPLCRTDFDVDVVKEDVEVVKEDVEVVKEDIEVVKEDIEVVKEDIEVVKEDIEVVKEDIEVVKEDIEVAKEDIEVVKEDIEVVKEDIEAVKEDIEVVKEDIEVVKLYIEVVKLYIEVVKLDIEVVKDVEVVKEDIEVVKEVEVVKEDVEVVKEDVEVVEEDVEVVEEDVEVVEEDVEVVEEDVEVVKEDIEVVKEDIEVVEEDIEVVKEDVEVVEEDIEVVKEDIEVVKEDVEVVEENVEEDGVLRALNDFKRRCQSLRICLEEKPAEFLQPKVVIHQCQDLQEGFMNTTTIVESEE